MIVNENDPLKYHSGRLTLIDRICKWQLQLVEFDIHFLSTKSVKGRSVVDYIADFLGIDASSLEIELSNENIMAVEK